MQVRAFERYIPFKTMKLFKNACLNDNLIFCLIDVKTGLSHGIHDI